MRVFASRYSVSDAWRSRWSGEKFSQHRHPRAERDASSRAGSCWPPPRARCRASTRRSVRSARGPRLPPVQRAQPAGFAHAADQRRRRGLALRAGDRDDAPLEESRRQFQLADDRHARSGARPARSAATARRRGSSRSGRRRRTTRRGAVRARSRHPMPSSAETSASSEASDSVTRAPRLASHAAAARPLRAAPTTSTRRPSIASGGSPGAGCRCTSTSTSVVAVIAASTW